MPPSLAMDPAEVLIIGAGPSGTVAAAALHQHGIPATIVEASSFPRFVIGESLLPACTDLLQRVDLLDVIRDRGYQYKDGGHVWFRNRRSVIDFGRQFSQSYGYTYQMARDDFDKTLADTVAARGTRILYQHKVVALDLDGERPQVTLSTPSGETLTASPSFVFDASGFGRVAPRLLGLDRPMDLPPMASVFTHVTGINWTKIDRQKALINVHPSRDRMWLWVIPFSDDRVSVGIVGSPDSLPDTDCFHALLREFTDVAPILAGATPCRPIQRIAAYGCDVSTLCQPHLAILGNAGSFIDPIFSSGVAIAMQSGWLAADVLARQRNGEAVTFPADYEKPMRDGVAVFNEIIRRWYDGTLEHILCYGNKPEDIERMLCSLLSGYVWDARNPYTRQTPSRLGTLSEICSAT